MRFLRVKTTTPRWEADTFLCVARKLTFHQWWRSANHINKSQDFLFLLAFLFFFFSFFAVSESAALTQLPLGGHRWQRTKSGQVGLRKEVGEQETLRPKKKRKKNIQSEKRRAGLWLDFHKCCRHCVGKLLHVFSYLSLTSEVPGGGSHQNTEKLSRGAPVFYVRYHQHLHMHTFNAGLGIL